MAGKAGRSGGPRPNSGGARAGSGRPAKEEEQVFTLSANQTDDPLVFMLAVMNDSNADPRMRLEAAKSAAQYIHHKKGEGGKAEEKEAAAKKAGAGKFGAASPPSNVVKMRG